MGQTVVVAPRTTQQEAVSAGRIKQKPHDTYPTFIGIGLILVIALASFIANTKSGEDLMQFYALLLVIRTAFSVWVIMLAKERNRDAITWGIYGFISPIITLIVLGQKSKLPRH